MIVFAETEPIGLAQRLYRPRSCLSVPGSGLLAKDTLLDYAPCSQQQGMEHYSVSLTSSPRSQIRPQEQSGRTWRKSLLPSFLYQPSKLPQTIVPYRQLLQLSRL